MASDSHVPNDVPLGKETAYSFDYDADLLYPIPRSLGRDALNKNAENFCQGLLISTYSFFFFGNERIWKVFMLEKNIKFCPVCTFS